MTQTIIHQPRVAWDGARVFVAATLSNYYPWLSAEVGRLLGGDCRRQLAETRALLLADVRPDAIHVEAGIWRVRLEDLLRHRPDLTAGLADLIRQTSEQLSGRPTAL
ncbi:hypothetical protein ACRYCC_18880 [Actinomadura scrupuli]|uniref:hypothetical protein n=1 Tax=Actinomadura scrupuli TaxID=559629 RepID=UPI003D97B3D3